MPEGIFNFADIFTAAGLVTLGQVILIDLTMAGDNVVIIGTLTSGLPARERQKVILFGVGMALVFLIGFALIATRLLQITGLLIAGGLLLLWVAYNMYRELTPSALTLLINRENAMVVDLSSTQDFDKGHVPSARNVQMSQFDPENKELAKVKELPVAVYCKTGTIAAQAAARFVKAGFKQVYWLGGGLAA